MNPLCSRHEDALQLALELRGLLRPTLIADADLAPLFFARQAILDHASNFSGRAALRMLTDQRCALCFVNEAIRRGGQNPGLTVDAWVDEAAEEALAHDIATQDADAPAQIVV
jgi:hypothetical protein